MLHGNRVAQDTGTADSPISRGGPLPNQRKRENEAAWVTVAHARLPGHLTWAGFCRTLGWRGSVPVDKRVSDNLKLEFYARAARSLGMNTAWFISEIMAELKRRQIPKAEG